MENKFKNIGYLEIIILSALSFREQYGLEIITTVKKERNKIISIGSIYTTLHRLEKKGFVKSRWGEATEERAGARRRYYKITGEGEKVLKNAKEDFIALWKYNPSFMGSR